MPKQLFAIILALSAFWTTEAFAACISCRYETTDTSAVLWNEYNGKHEKLWEGALRDGVWHETSYGPLSGKPGGRPLGDISLGEGHISGVLKGAKSVMVLDLLNQTLVFDKEVDEGKEFTIDTKEMGEGVQMLAALDEKGSLVDAVFFKKPNVCSYAPWISR